MLVGTSMNIYTAVVQCGNDRWTEAGWRSGPVVMNLFSLTRDPVAGGDAV
jgi:hypothetical protein